MSDNLREQARVNRGSPRGCDSAVASVVPLATQITELHHKTTVRFRAFTSLYDISSFRRACILRSCATKALESPPTPPTAPTQLAHASARAPHLLLGWARRRVPGSPRSPTGMARCLHLSSAPPRPKSRPRSKSSPATLSDRPLAVRGGGSSSWFRFRFRFLFLFLARHKGLL